MIYQQPTVTNSVKFNELYYRNNQTGECFLTLKAAIDKAVLDNTTSSNTITVLNSKTGANAETDAVTIPANKEITLNLNGKTVALDGVSITNNGTLTITDPTTTHTIATDGGYELNVAGNLTSNNVAIQNYGTLNISGNAEISGTGVSSTIGNYKTIVIESGTVYSYNATSIHNGPNGVKANTAIEGGTIISSKNTTIVNRGILAEENDSNPLTESILITANANVIAEGSKNGIAISNLSSTGKIKITGGEVTSTGTVTQNGSNSDTISNVNGILDITGGKIESKNAAGVSIVGGTGIISGGEIIGDTYGIWINVGTVTVGSNDTSKELSITANRCDGILNNSGDLTILSGTIESNSTNSLMAGVRNATATGTITIGDISGTPSTSIPSIISTNTIGVKIDAGTVNFYDGIITGSVNTQTMTGQSIVGTVNNVPSQYEVLKNFKLVTENNTTTIYEEAKLYPQNWANYAEYTTYNDGTTDHEVLINYYNTLSDAFTNSASGNTVKVINGVTETTLARVVEGKTLTFETKENETTTLNEQIANFGTLTISGAGNITTTSAINMIENGGTLNISNSGTISNNNTGEYSAILNLTGATVNKIGSGTISSNTVRNTITNGNVNISAGIVSTSGRDAINSNEPINISGTAKISCSTPGNSGSAIYASNSLVVSGNAEIEKTGTGAPGTVVIGGSGTATLSGGKIKTASGSAAMALHANTSGTITINGATIESAGTSTAYAIKKEGTGNINISSGTVTASGANTIYNNNATGTITISGGEVKNTGGFSAVNNYVAGTVNINTGAKLSSVSGPCVHNQAGGTIQINGGEITSTGCHAVYNYGQGTLNIAGGTIHTTGPRTGGANPDAIGNYNGTVNISGGTISSAYAAGIATNGGTVSVTSGIIQGQTWGVWMGTTSSLNPKLVLGTQGSGVNVNSPIIIGKTCGIYSGGNASVEFYDGVIYGPTTTAYEGAINDTSTTTTETNYVLVNGTEAYSGTTYKFTKLGPSTPVLTLKLTNASGATYTSGDWTKEQVYVSMTSSQTGAGIQEYQRTLSPDSKDWTNTYITTTNGTGTLTYYGDRNGTYYFRAIDVNGLVSGEASATIRMDSTAPTVTFGTNGNSSASSTASTTVTVTDSGCGVNASTLKYLWTTMSNITSATYSGTGVYAEYFTGNNSGTFTSGSTLTLPSGNGGEYYLYIYAEDNLGNTTITKSNKFTVSNIEPEADITLSTTEMTNSNITMTIKPYAPTVLCDRPYWVTQNRDSMASTLPTNSYAGQKFRVTCSVKTLETANTSIKTGLGFCYNNGSSRQWKFPAHVTTGTAQTEQNINFVYTIPSDYSSTLQTWCQIEISNGTAGYKVEYKNVKYEYFDYTKIASVTVNGTPVTLTDGVGTYTITQNGTYTIVITDIYGNTKTYTKEITNKYITVTANANGGTIPTTSGWTVASGSTTATKSVTYNSTYGTLPTPTRSGYTFQGWNGKNLLNYNNVLSTAQYFGIYADANGNIIDSTPTSDIRTWNYANSNWQLTLEPGTYTLSLNFSQQSTQTSYSQLAIIKENGSVISGNTANNLSGVDNKTVTFTLTETTNIGIIAKGYDGVYKVQLEKGSSETSWEPYYVTATTTVTNFVNHTLKAIWKEN